MQRKFIWLVLMLFMSLPLFSQKATLTGNVSDEVTGETIVGASVVLEGTTTGAMTDFDGNFIIKNITPGTYNIRCSFISYESQKVENVQIIAEEETKLTFKLGEAVVKVEEVKVVAKVNRETEALLLMEQRDAEGIKESIGARRLASLGVSNASGATTKISGVTKNESSGDVYIRGLGDRYLTTTMNGLPIPSDDVEKKNIDLNLFSTDIIKNVGINKTYSAESYGDQSSGAVDISSKSYSEKITIDLSTGTNTNIFANGIFTNFRATQNLNKLFLGFHNQSVNTADAITNQSWNTRIKTLPIDRGLSFSIGKQYKVANRNLEIFGTVSQDNSSDHEIGVYKKYRSNILDNSFTDAETFSSNFNTTALLNISYELSKNSKLNFNSLVVHKTTDQLYEQGRNGEGYVFDQDPKQTEAFVRDQNTKITTLFVNQLIGTHKLSDKNQLKWATAFNLVNASEPNRIRNEVNIFDNYAQFSHVGDFQQRKSNQIINDLEFNGYIKNELKLLDEETRKLKLIYGVNARYKMRDFSSLFIGVRAKGVQVASIDNLDEALTDAPRFDTRELILRTRKEDTYNANLGAYAGFLNVAANLEKFSGTIGLRYELDLLHVGWDVGNYVGRIGNIAYPYHNFLPAMNLKYALSDKSALRLAASKTITLPEFKELAPFEYVSPTGRVTKGNPSLQKSVNYNIDLKWEMFPSNKELISATGFYKLINDPINFAQTRGSSGNFTYANTGKKANVYGLELESKVELIKAKSINSSDLYLVLNATKMWFNQDLLEDYQYNNKTESGLQGASDFITNAALTYSNNKENEFAATITANYSSDKILALGAPEDFQNSDILFNNEIIEKGFTSIDMVLTKQVSEKISLKLSGKNLLNPKIEQTQDIKPLSGALETAVVSSYRKGMSFSFSVKINLNK